MKKVKNGANLKIKTLGLYLQNQKWYSTLVGQKNAEADSSIKNSSKEPKKGKKDPNGAELRIKRQGCVSKTQVDSLN